MQITHHLSELWKKQKGSFFMKHRVDNNEYVYSPIRQTSNTKKAVN